MKIIEKYFKKKKYQITLYISLSLLCIGLDFIHLYYNDEKTGEKIFFQKGIKIRFPFIELSVLKHIKENNYENC